MCFACPAVEIVLPVGRSRAWLTTSSVALLLLLLYPYLRVVWLAEYLASVPDPVAQFSAPILQHMNDDHSATTKAKIEHYITGGVEVRSRKSPHMRQIKIVSRSSRS